MAKSVGQMAKSVGQMAKSGGSEENLPQLYSFYFALVTVGFFL